MTDKTMDERLTELYSKGDIGMYYCGKRVDTENHVYGPEIRNHYLFVLVNKGQAVMYQDKEIFFGEHDLLVMLPNERIHYKAMEAWSISWLGLYGQAVDKFIKTIGITPDNPIIHISLYNELYNIIEKIYDISKDLSLSSRLSATGLIYEFFSVLSQNFNIDKENIDIIKNAIKRYKVENVTAIYSLPFSKVYKVIGKYCDDDHFANGSIVDAQSQFLKKSLKK